MKAETFWFAQLTGHYQLQLMVRNQQKSGLARYTLQKWCNCNSLYNYTHITYVIQFHYISVQNSDSRNWNGFWSCSLRPQAISLGWPKYTHNHWFDRWNTVIELWRVWQPTLMWQLFCLLGCRTFQKCGGLTVVWRCRPLGGGTTQPLVLQRRWVEPLCF